MGVFKAAAVQMRSGESVERNARDFEGFVREAASKGATYVQTPEMTGALVRDKDARKSAFTAEERDPIAVSAARLSAELGIAIHVGSTAILRPDGKLANRAFLFGPDGALIARYDKIHMFDADVASGESYRESASVAPGTQAVLADGPARIGMTVCYDMRFPQLYRRLAQAGAQVLTVPAAFTVPTGQAHWHVLLRARAIETGCFVLAPAQCGTHPATLSQPPTPRRSYGHSLAVAPWGEVLADAGEQPGVTLVDLDLSRIDAARQRIASLRHDRAFSGP